jgi:hypothetical protein
MHSNKLIEDVKVVTKTKMAVVIDAQICQMNASELLNAVSVLAQRVDIA